jgi:hypothetical protein
MDARAHEREQAEPDRGGRGGMTPTGIEGPEAARDALTHDLDLPRGRSRERVQAHGREYRLSGSEVRTLAAAGAFRVVPAGELTPSDTRTPTRPSREIERLESAGLVKTTPYIVGRTRTRSSCSPTAAGTCLSPPSPGPGAGAPGLLRRCPSRRSWRTTPGSIRRT